MIGYSIRKVELNEIDSLVTLMSQHADYEEADFVSEGKKERLTHLLFSSPQLLHCYVITIDKQLKGYFSFTYDISTWDASNYLHLDCLFLQENARGNGIGEEILKFLKEEALKKDCVNIQWQTPVFNSPAIEFYKKNGAKSKTKERFFLKLN